MSSLAAAQADGYYYPPDYDGTKHKSLNDYRGTHALGKRARKQKTEKTIVIRFEMPFPVTCSGCQSTIGKGTRFNAEKKQVGMYYSTKLWSFRMKSACCKQVIEIRTDPKNADYVVESGATRKIDPALDLGGKGTELGNQVIDLRGEGERALQAQRGDAFEVLERSERQKRAASAANDEIRDLQARSNLTTLDTYGLNRELRSKNRRMRKREKGLEREGKALGLSEEIKLLPRMETEPGAANFQLLRSRSVGAASSRQKKRRKIRRQSIFQ